MLRSMLRMATLAGRTRRPTALRSLPIATLLVAGAAASLGCGADSFTPQTRIDEQTLYWRLDINHRAVLLSTAAPYDTLRLLATPRNYRGDPILGAPSPQYTSRDLTRVIVTPDGLLQAVAPVTPGTAVAVIARLQIDGLTHVDTVFVSVVSTDPPPMLDSISIQPIPPDSAKLATTQSTFGWGLSDTLAVRAFDMTGAPMLTLPGNTAGVLPVRLSVADTAVAQFDKRIFLTNKNAEIRGYRVGSTMLYASTTAFGVTKTDSLLYRIGWPIAASINLTSPGKLPPGNTNKVMPTPNLFTMPIVRIAVGGIVRWSNFGTGFDSTINTAIVFKPEDLHNVGSMTPRPPFLSVLEYFSMCQVPTTHSDCAGTGNMVIDPTTRQGARRFFAPGTYEYRSTQFPESVGQVVVIAED